MCIRDRWRIDHFKSPVVVEIHSTTGRGKRQTVNIDRLVPCTQSTVSPETVVKLPVDSQSTLPSTELDSQVMEDDSQLTEEESQFFQESNSFDSFASLYPQRSSRKRKPPKFLEDYII